MYSFDFHNSHFVMLSDYFDGSTDASGKPDLAEATLKWLQSDLAATRQPLIWVACHKPIECLPDMDSGRLRHAGDSLVTDPARRKYFVDLLQQYRTRPAVRPHPRRSRRPGAGRLAGGFRPRPRCGRSRRARHLPENPRHRRARLVDVYRADAKGDHYQLRKTVELD